MPLDFTIASDVYVVVVEQVGERGSRLPLPLLPAVSVPIEAVDLLNAAFLAASSLIEGGVRSAGFSLWSRRSVPRPAEGGSCSWRISTANS